MTGNINNNYNNILKFNNNSKFEFDNSDLDEILHRY